MNNTSNSPLLRLVRLLRPHANPLARGVDRLESLTLVLAGLLGLLLVPVMLVFGSLAHAAVAQDGAQAAGTRHEAVATLIADAPTASTEGHDYSATAKVNVRASWVTVDGATRTGLIKASAGLRSGAKVTIWLDSEDGRVVDKPASPDDAAVAGVAVALVGWLAAVGLLALGQLSVHSVLNRRRFRAWGQEWARFEPEWNTYRRR